MKKIILILFVAGMLVPGWAQKPKQLVARGAVVQQLAGGFRFTEGPAADARGNVYFTDQPNNRIYIWDLSGKLSLFHEDCGRANGLYFDLDGNLLSCSDMENELWSISPSGEHSVLISEYGGKRLNGPNDLWVHPGGSIYFTDPLYVRPYWTRNPGMQQDGQHVYRLSPDRKTLTRVVSDLEQPNGIVGSPDGKLLYVADIKAGKTFRYTILPDGSLADKTLFAPLGSDGMTMDHRGNLYLTGQGVTVFNPRGEKIVHIPVEARWTANVCFGGKDGKTLFITASEYVYGLRMKVKGAR